MSVWNRRAIAYVLAAVVVGVAGTLAITCVGDRNVKPSNTRYGGPLSAQGAAPTTSFSGVLDPTNTPWAMTPCTSSCSSFAAGNGTAFKTVVDLATNAALPRTVYIPPGEYPMPCGVVIGGDSNVFIDAQNVTFRLTGSAASCAMLQVKNGAHIKIRGAIFSMRDATSTTTDTVALELGDGGTTTLDDVQLIDDAFVEGVGGDYVRIDGGTTAITVTNVQITQGSRFENGPRAAIDIRKGVGRLTVSYDFFQGQANRDIWFEDVADGPLGQSAILANNIERSTTGTAVAVTLSGHGTVNQNDRVLFALNHIKHITGASNASGTTWPGGGGTIEGTHLARATIEANSIVTNLTSSSPSINLVGDVTDVQLIDNYVDRRGGASNAAVVSVKTDSTYAPQHVVIARNRVLQYSGAAPGIDITGCQRCTLSANHVTYHATTADSGSTGFAGIYCAGDATTGACSGWWSANQIARDYQDIKASLDLSTVTTHDNTVVQYAVPGLMGNTATLQFIGDSGTKAGSVTGDNFTIVIHFKAASTQVSDVEALLVGTLLVKTPGTGSNVLQVGDAFGPVALSPAPQAGRPLAGFEALVGGGTTINALSWRDNFVIGARDELYCDANGSAAWPEGYPLLSGNSGTSLTNEIEGGLATYRTELTTDAETIGGGALSPTKRMTFVTAAGGSSLTLGDGVQDGIEKVGKIKTYSGSGNVTMTPTHFADGTTHTLTWNASGGFFRLRWDATSSTWRLTGSSGVTLN